MTEREGPGVDDRRSSEPVLTSPSPSTAPVAETRQMMSGPARSPRGTTTMEEIMLLIEMMGRIKIIMVTPSKKILAATHCPTKIAKVTVSSRLTSLAAAMKIHFSIEPFKGKISKMQSSRNGWF